MFSLLLPKLSKKFHILQFTIRYLLVDVFYWNYFLVSENLIKKLEEKIINYKLQDQTLFEAVYKIKLKKKTIK
jgi:hypothetical protein